MDLTDLAHAMRRAVRLVCLLPILWWVLPAGAASFVPIEVESELNDLDIEVSSSSIGSRVMLGLANVEEFDVLCTARFHNGPQTPVDRRATVVAGERTQMTAPLQRMANRVRIQLNCERQQAQE